MDLYVFDRALRLIVMDAVERVEVAVRAAITDQMATTLSDPHWYANAAHFKDRRRHEGLLTMVRDTCNTQLDKSAEADAGQLIHRSALEHYLTTYASPELPPSWLMVETLTLGQLDGLYRNLKRRADKTAIARVIGLNASLLESWLRTYVRIRNVCAHHGRLWNLGLGVYPQIPVDASVPWLEAHNLLDSGHWDRQRLYPVLVSLQAILETIAPKSSWASRLSDLLNDHPAVPLRGMGMPRDWREDPFWSRHLAQ